MKTITICSTLFMLLAFPVLAMEKALPFKPGEKLTYKLSWTIIPAGEATLEVLPLEMIKKVPVYRFRLTARSNAFVDRFYKVRDRIDAWVDETLAQTLIYRKKQLEGRTRRDVEVVFDWDNLSARYLNFNEPRDPIPILPGTFDPLSAFFYIRTLNLREGMEIRRPVSDGKKCVMGIARVIKRETIRVVGRHYDTYLIEPELKHIGGVFEKSKNAKIRLWVTADHRSIPIRIKSKVVVGSFTGDLVNAEGILAETD